MPRASYPSSIPWRVIHQGGYANSQATTSSFQKVLCPCFAVNAARAGQAVPNLWVAASLISAEETGLRKVGMCPSVPNIGVLLYISATPWP